ncbi:hypothetical protein AB1K70_09210 [Bremerella sp. JC770]|uniref:hypothetical protein n=1 Tax=Bremerella sp. JC770 TaxID=3232137 RepID=UPI00345A1EF0
MQKQSKRLSNWFAAGLLAGCLTMTGCFAGGTDGPELSKVTGLVTMKGQPVPNVQVMFAPVADEGSSRGRTKEDGTFEVYYTLERPGAVRGEHHVQFESRGADADAIGIPRKYLIGNDGGIPVNVTAEGPNEFTFELSK